MHILILLLHVAFVFASSPTFLNLTAISAAKSESILECWQLSSPFSVSDQPGTAGVAIEQLGNVANATFTVLPAEFDGGLHNAPSVQYVAFTSGEAVISLPNSTQTATVKGGKYGLIIAADTASVSKYGHITMYPTKQETIALQIPTAGGAIPQHKVLHGGACTAKEQSY